jgi:hypothetical protein
MSSVNRRERHVGLHRQKDTYGISIMDHIATIFNEREIRYQQRFDAQTTAINAAMAAAEKAVTKAEIAAEKRFELLNELRIGVATKEEVTALEKLITALKDELNLIRTLMSETKGKSTGLKDGYGYLLGAGGLALAIIAFLTK